MGRSATDPGAQRVLALVETLPRTAPWDLSRFVADVARSRGKPIQVIAHRGLAMLDQPCGLWIGRDDDDILVYDNTTSAYHGEQIVLHELGHVLLDHGGEQRSVVAVNQIARLLPDFDVSTVQQVLGRNVYDTEEERQAELFASVVLSQRRHAPSHSRFLHTFLRDPG